MLTETPPADGVLKYFGLPGIDFLDLRHFHAKICHPRNIKLRFLGFNTSVNPKDPAQADLNVSLDEVRRLQFIDPQSEVIGDNFSLIADERSLACLRARQLGPYDVINLDLCDGFGAKTPGAPNNNYYEAVRSLLALQTYTKNPWLLLLTTRVDKPNINQKMLQILIKKYLDNLASCNSFLEASSINLSITTEKELHTAIKSSDGLLSVFLVGICKWLLGMSLAHTPPLSMEVRSTIGYRVLKSSESEDIVSIALKFKPTFLPADDPFGIATKAAIKPNECVLSTKALKRIAKRIDADELLHSKPELFQVMLEATTQLLNLARYDTTTYPAWAHD